MILVLVLDPFNVMDADQLCWLLERGGKETYSLVDGFNLLSGKIWKLNLDGLEISPGKSNYILQSTHPRRSISVMQGVGKNVLFTVLCECGKKVSSRQELGMINYTGTSLPSTASLLSFQGAMRSKEGCPNSGLGWVLPRAGTEPQLVLPLHKGQWLWLLCPLFASSASGKLSSSSSGGHSKGTGARKGGTWDLPPPQCLLLPGPGQMSWLAQHLEEIWEILASCTLPCTSRDRHWAAALLLFKITGTQACNFCQFMCGEHGPGKANATLQLGKILLRQRAGEAELSKGKKYYGVTILRKENILIVQNIQKEKLCKAAHKANSSRKVEEAVLPNVLRSLSG